MSSKKKLENYFDKIVNFGKIFLDPTKFKQFQDDSKKINLFLSNLDKDTQVITDNKQLLQIMFDNTCNQIINLNKQLDNNLDVIKLLQKVDEDPADMVSQEKLVKLRKEIGILWLMNQNEQKDDDKYIKCPTCKGRGFYSVDYHFVKEETWAKCDDCDGKGKINKK